MKATTALAAVAACMLAAYQAHTAAQGWRKHCFDPGAPPVVIGANWQLTGIGIDSEVPKAAEQLELVKFEINKSCGLRVDDMDVGVPLTVLIRDNETLTALAPLITQQLIDSGAVAIVGGGNSVLAPPAVLPAFRAGIAFGLNQAAADSLGGCTDAELADPAVTKSLTPVYGPATCWKNDRLVFRTTSTGYLGGTVAAKYARETYPALVNAAFLFRNDDFGRPNRDGFRDTFVPLGGAILAESGFSIQTTTVADFKNMLRTVTAGNPSLIAANPNVARLRFLMQAYVELRDDPTWSTKPSNFDTLRFLWTTTATAGTFGDLSPAVLTALVNQAESVQSAWDPDSPGFQRWFSLYRAFKPGVQPPASSFAMTAYDALMVMSLAITAAGSTDGAAIAAKLRDVTNPPGKCIYPGDWEKAFRRLAKGKDINYEGALGPVDLDERGNATGIAHGVFRVQSDGSTAMVRVFGSAAQQSVCEADEEEGDEDS